MNSTSLIRSIILLILVAQRDVTLVSGYSTRVAPTTDRRGWINGVASATAAGLVVGESTMLPQVTLAAEESSKQQLTVFQDDKNGFSMKVPTTWVESVRTLPDRRTIRFWADPTDTQTFLFIAYTAIRDDFTSLASFGSVETVADQTILPKGELAGVTDTESKMLAAVSERQAYFFDYQQKVPGAMPMTHFRTIFTMQPGATGGAGSILVTVTAQTPEERYVTLKPVFDDMMNSFQKIKLAV